jgi:hypothetical protein
MSYEVPALIYREHDLNCPVKPMTAKLVDNRLAVVTTPSDVDASLVIGYGVLMGRDPSFDVSCADCPGMGCRLETHGETPNLDGIIETFNTAELVPSQGRLFGKIAKSNIPIHSVIWEVHPEEVQGSTEVVIDTPVITPPLSDAEIQQMIANGRAQLAQLSPEQRVAFDTAYPIIFADLLNGVPFETIITHVADIPLAVETVNTLCK